MITMVEIQQITGEQRDADATDDQRYADEQAPAAARLAALDFLRGIRGTGSDRGRIAPDAGRTTATILRATSS